MLIPVQPNSLELSISPSGYQPQTSPGLDFDLTILLLPGDHDHDHYRTPPKRNPNHDAFAAPPRYEVVHHKAARIPRTFETQRTALSQAIGAGAQIWQSAMS